MDFTGMIEQDKTYCPKWCPYYYGQCSQQCESGDSLVRKPPYKSANKRGCKGEEF